jgi:serine/threonine protein kinase
MVARYIATGRFYALKLQKKSEIVRLKQVQHVKDEKAILSSISHPYVVNLLAAFQDSARIVLVLEFVTGGEMFTFLRRARCFDNERAKLYAAQIVSAFDYLHQRNIIYRDLKPENLLFASNGHVKVTDFGFAKVVPDKTYTVCGTPEYIAPEIIRSQGHSAGADWWALGVLVYEMLAGYPPFYADNPFGIYEKILSAAPIPFPPHIDKDAKDLIKQLLQHDLTKRFGCMRNGAADIKEHKWFKNIDWPLLDAGQVTAAWQPPQGKEGEATNFDKYQEEKLKTEMGDDPYAKLFADF